VRLASLVALALERCLRGVPNRGVARTKYGDVSTLEENLCWAVWRHVVGDFLSERRASKVLASELAVRESQDPTSNALIEEFIEPIPKPV